MHQHSRKLGFKKATLKFILPLLVPALLHAGSAKAIDCITTKKLNVSTGWDNAYSSLQPIGANDGNWAYSNATPAMMASAGVAVSGPSFVIPTYSGWGAPAGAAWISCTSANGFGTSYNANYDEYSMLINRTFRLCKADSITLSFRIYCDDFASDLLVDGVSQGTPQPSGPSVVSANFVTGTVISKTIWLGPGSHTLTIRATNVAVNLDPNPFGICVNGSLVSLNQQLIAPNSPENCACFKSDCSDTCYWKVTGNNILGGNNVLGTLTNDDVRIQTSSTDRGIITADGRLGWNVMTPTTLLHVLCGGQYHAPSDIRFEKLPFGHGQVLVIDDQGYVFQSDKLAARSSNPELSNEIDQLKEEVALLQQQVALLSSSASASATDIFIYPNPAKNNLDIRLLGSSSELKNVEISIVDMGGKQLLPPVTSGEGNQSFSVNITALPAGVYVANLRADGKLITKKKFVVEK